MSTPAFLQIHTLHSYTAALLNRDDTGQAKSIDYGGVSRTRISSQCLKRHWRMAVDDPHSLQKLAGYTESYRSRELVTQKVIAPLRGHFPDEILQILDPEFQKLVYGDKADKGKKSRQTLLLGATELDWLATRAREIAEESDGDVSAVKESIKNFVKNKNYKAMADGSAMPGGLIAGLFGRMVTSDPSANIEAPVYVAHSFTVHAAERETDYFTALDDLSMDEPGADTIQETELTNGLYYGYVVVNMIGLVANCGGNKDLASKVIHNLLYLIAEISPGAKRGSTAPFGRANLMLVESGNRQPRSLATAYRSAIQPNGMDAVAKMDRALQDFDQVYATGELRRYFSIDGNLTNIDKSTLPDLATWAASKIHELPEPKGDSK